MEVMRFCIIEELRLHRLGYVSGVLYVVLG